MSAMEVIYSLLENPEIKSFFGCYTKDDGNLIIEFIINSAVSFIRENFEKIPDFKSIQAVIQTVYSGYNSQKSIDSLQGQLKVLKSEVLRLEEMTVKLQTSSQYSSVSEENRKFKGGRYFNKPSSEWRTGCCSIFRKYSEDLDNFRSLSFEPAKNNANSLKIDLDPRIYPEWWLELCEKPEALTPELSSQKHLRPKPLTKELKTEKGKKLPNPINKKTAEKSAEANLSSYHSISTDNHVKFSEKTPEKSKSLCKYAKSSELLEEIQESASSSSTSNFYPSLEMKKFYKGEFYRLFGNSMQVNYSSKTSV